MAVSRSVAVESSRSASVPSAGGAALPPGRTAGRFPLVPGSLLLNLSGTGAREPASRGEIVRARIAGIAQSLREIGVVVRAVDIPQSERSELLSCVGSN